MEETTVVLIGGSGGMSERYRRVAAERGIVLRHYERRVPGGVRRSLGKVAAVLIVVGMVSHALRDQAMSLAPAGAKVLYLRTASVSALREAVDAIGT
jgi:hypothetical protein